MPSFQHCVVVAAVSLVAAGARAEVIDFNEFAERFQDVASFTSGPLSFSSDSGYLGVELLPSPVGPDNGTPYLIDSRGTLSFSRTDGEAFRLEGFEMAQSWFTTQPVAWITVSYDLAAGGVASDTLVLTQASAFKPFWPRLYVTAVHFSLDDDDLGGGYIALDNIAIAPVPEPATWASFGAGLALLAAMRRRRGAAATASTA